MLVLSELAQDKNNPMTAYLDLNESWTKLGIEYEGHLQRIWVVSFSTIRVSYVTLYLAIVFLVGCQHHRWVSGS